MAPFQIPLHRRDGVGLTLYGLLALCLCGLMVAFLQVYRQDTRGVTYTSGIPFAPQGSTTLPSRPAQVPPELGVDLYLPLQADPAGISQAGFAWVRLPVAWDQVELVKNQYRWESLDRAVAEVITGTHHLAPVLVIQGWPAWLGLSPLATGHFTQTLDSYEQFVAALARRYQGQVPAYQIGETPNLAESWQGPPDPARYLLILQAAARQVKAVAPQTLILTAALAPTTETSPRALNDVQFLQQFYAAGARGSFDILAVQALGFWSGPEDRRVGPDILNLSRVILAREEMVKAGDGDRPIWATGFGWGALPAEYTGESPPWGNDTPTKQTARTLGGLRRARAEWTWMGVVFLGPWLLPAPDDPLSGFALHDALGQPRLALDMPAELLSANQPGSLASPLPNLLLAEGLLAFALVVVGWRTVWLLRRVDLAGLWRSGSQSFQALLPWQQVLVAAGLLVVLALSPWWWLTAALWLVLVIIFSWQPVLGLQTVIITAPFYLHPKIFLGWQFSLAELMLWALLVPMLWAWWQQRRRWSGALRDVRHLAVLGLVVLGLVASIIALYKGVALREWRTSLLEPALFYAGVRWYLKDHDHPWVLIDALVAAGWLVAGVGLFSFLFLGDVIRAEGVLRLRSVYGSPNNTALFLERVLPFTIVFLFGPGGRRRNLYLAAGVFILLAFFLTLSRGGLLLGLPAALLVMGWMRSRKALLAALAACLVVVVALLPLAGTARLSSLLNPTAGTGGVRLALWRSALEMIRDHPVLGVGPDNFLPLYRDRYIKPEGQQEPDLSHPHNWFLDFWLRLGILGPWLFILLAGVTLFRCHRLARGSDPPRHFIPVAVAGAIAAVLAHGLIDNSFFVPDLAYTFLLLVALV
ncbi:MAG: O-antigen ligase family protein [Chloroflexi bacterium]|nr:O-antigen ligase family protein [Chloroflexota bacterium]